MKSKIGRRDFLQKSALTAAAFTVVPGSILGKSHGYQAPSDKLNIACAGIGGQGSSNLRAVSGMAASGANRAAGAAQAVTPGAGENIVALCDVDWKYGKPVFDRYPNAKRYWDYRKMYEEMSKDIDAIIVATPDHTHAIIASEAMMLGKHVFVQKPLTHSVYESRLLTKFAEKYQVATQMGNQGASGEGVNQVCEWIWNGEIGEITKVECATDRPIWPQGLNTPEKADKIPSTLNWDLFTGPAVMRPYNALYHPWNWRGWWPYGTGALGDMACHIMHPAFKALKLGYPVKAEGSSTLLLNECAPQAQHVKLTYPARENMPKVAMPEVEIHWYDGGMMPERPKGFPEGRELMGFGGGLVIFHGTKDTLLCGCYGRGPWLLSGRVPNVPQTERRVENSRHEMDWIRACKENPANRVKTKSDFSEAGPFNEMVVMGVLAVRLKDLHKELHWDGQNMKFTNIGADETIKTVIKDGFTIEDGHPSFNKTWTEPVNAQAFAAELINHKYREGWKLPDMPA
ncbi:MAG: Gfo/Idh/MocA family oxidoreductase [Tannerellaceae bacterium]|nr:Gfo/Idh/MocA family oxidoreductase [Tannerellaceae bacterium]